MKKDPHQNNSALRSKCNLQAKFLTDSKIIISSAIIVGQNNFPFFVNIAPTTSVGPRDLRCTVEDEVRENLNRFSSELFIL